MAAVPCPHCKRAINATFTKCPFCGGEVKSGAALPTAPVAAPPVGAKVLPCPSCGRPINATFAQCPFCKAAVNRSPGKAPLSRDYAGMALKVCEALRPEWSLDVSIASALQLETLLAANYGSQGAGPREGEWTLDPRESGLLVALGALFGEIVRKTFGGEWSEERGATNPLDAGVKLPDGTLVMVVAKVYKRARFGSGDSPWEMFEGLRTTHRAIPDNREIQGFLRVAAHLESRGLMMPAFQFVQEVSKRELPAGLRQEVKTFEDRLLPKMRAELAKMAAGVIPGSVRPSPKPPSPQRDWEEIGGEIVFANAGVRLAHSVASLSALDLWITLKFGPAHVPEPVREEPDNVKLERVVGAWLGEYFVQVLGGKWEPESEPRVAHVTWPNGFRTCPHVYFSKRLQNGDQHSVRAQVNALVDVLIAQKQVAGPLPDDPGEWFAQAEYYAKAIKQVPLAALYAREAIARRPDHGPWRVQFAEWCDGRAEKLGEVHPGFEPVAAWEAVLSLEPSNGRALTSLASLALAEGDVEKAGKYAESALASDSASATAWTVMGRVHQELGRDDDALAAYTRASSIDPKEVAPRLARARLLLAHDRAAEARAQMTSIRRLASMPPEGTELQALAEERLGHRRDAHHLWNSLATDSRTPDALKTRATQRRDALSKTLEFRLDAAEYAGNTQAMVDAYLAVTRDFPNSNEAFRELGVGYAILGRFDDALAALDRAIAIDPKDRKARDHKAVALGRMKRFADAVASLDQGLLALPNDPVLLSRKGVMCALGGDVPGAVTWLRKAIAAGDEGDAALFLSDAEGRLGDKEGSKETLKAWLATALGRPPNKVASARKALHKLEKGTNVDPVNAERWLDRGLAFANEGRTGEAFQAYEESLALDPSRADTWHNHGAALTLLRGDDDAIASFLEAEKLGAGAISQVARANALARSLRIDEALDLLDKVLTTNPDELSALLPRARLRQLGGRRDDALADFDHYLTHRPNDAAILDAKADLLDTLGRPHEARHARATAAALRVPNPAPT